MLYEMIDSVLEHGGRDAYRDSYSGNGKRTTDAFRELFVENKYRQVRT
jgi:hypothetical protein